MYEYPGLPTKPAVTAVDAIVPDVVVAYVIVFVVTEVIVKLPSKAASTPIT
jgi:hypothetical protein